MRRTRLFLLGLVLVSLVEAARQWNSAPSRVPSHFDAAGRPNAWGSRDELFLIHVGVTLLIAALFIVIPALLRSTPAGLINLPNKSYWLAPERREETMERLASSFEVFASATVLLLIVVFELTSLASRGGGLATSYFLPVLVSYLRFHARMDGRADPDVRERPARKMIPPGPLHPRLRPHVDRRSGRIALQEAGHALLLRARERRLELDLLERLRESARAAGVARGPVLEEGRDVRPVRLVTETRKRQREVRGRLAREAVRRARRSSPSGTPTRPRASRRSDAALRSTAIDSRASKSGDSVSWSASFWTDGSRKAPRASRIRPRSRRSFDVFRLGEEGREQTPRRHGGPPRSAPSEAPPVRSRNDRSATSSRGPPPRRRAPDRRRPPRRGRPRTNAGASCPRPPRAWT